MPCEQGSGFICCRLSRSPLRMAGLADCHAGTDRHAARQGAERKLRACRDDMLVELALMHDAEIAVLNAAHLGCAGPTNILSFPASPEEAGLGVLALGVETWLREATLYGQETEEHARHLLAHGLAHLLGHDHGPAMDECCAFLLEKSAEASSCTA